LQLAGATPFRSESINGPSQPIRSKEKQPRTLHLKSLSPCHVAAPQYPRPSYRVTHRGEETKLTQALHYGRPICKLTHRGGGCLLLASRHEPFPSDPPAELTPALQYCRPTCKLTRRGGGYLLLASRREPSPPDPPVELTQSISYGRPSCKLTCRGEEDGCSSQAGANLLPRTLQPSSLRPYPVVAPHVASLVSRRTSRRTRLGAPRCSQGYVGLSRHTSRRVSPLRKVLFRKVLFVSARVATQEGFVQKGFVCLGAPRRVGRF
jgi:hypothetical protein